MALPAKNFLASLLKYIYYKKTMALLAKTIKLKKYIYIYILTLFTPFLYIAEILGQLLIQCPLTLQKLHESNGVFIIYTCVKTK